AGMPAEACNPAGEMIDRNPGVALVWITRGYTLVSDGSGGTLFEVGPPLRVTAFAEGRHASRDEVRESVRTGLPIITAAAAAQGTEALAALRAELERAVRVLKIRRLEVPQVAA
ncbi:MAG TPA: hypothetical protein VFR37_07965, partial [Longimicrobium sp.]|nr:hypothetical protein [Longimicrobium sp.]